MNPYLKKAYQPYKWLVVAPFIFVNTAAMGLLCILSGLVLGQDAADIFAVIWSRACCGVALLKVKLKGSKNYNRNSAYVVVANHQSMADIPIIHGFMGLKIKWVMKKELDKIPIFGAACHRLGCIFIDRSDSRAAIRSIREGKRTLTENSSVFFFAEGTRSRNGRLLPFKKGAFIFALETGLPILPVTIKNSFRVLPSDSLDLTPGTIDVFVHAPVRLKPSDGDQLDQVITDIRRTIARPL
ncbi:lysophospholipid acyltransferase family protein [Desulfospira joergensenii]|uniref:lysophospholipid acyltransferase family protein n=1 Tax=Desulfospira joergensenii TaxID=53329 RepID=UPI0003B74E89|nr:lysophospholipid acyltransferase family protein [Desulfospira joergensenii]